MKTFMGDSKKAEDMDGLIVNISEFQPSELHPLIWVSAWL